MSRAGFELMLAEDVYWKVCNILKLE